MNPHYMRGSTRSAHCQDLVTTHLWMIHTHGPGFRAVVNHVRMRDIKILVSQSIQVMLNALACHLGPVFPWRLCWGQLSQQF